MSSLWRSVVAVASLVAVASAARAGEPSGPISTSAPVSPNAIVPPSNAPAADVPAAGGRDAARAALADGNRLLKEGDVDGAIAAYRRAQSLFPDSASKIEFNIGKAEAARGNEPAAAVAFERFLAQSLEIPPEFRQEARAELHRLAAALGTLKVDEPRPGLVIVVDGQIHGKTPLGSRVWVRPGSHIVAVEDDGRVVFERNVDVQSGSSVQIVVTITPRNRGGGAALPTAASLPSTTVVAVQPSWTPTNADTGTDERPYWKRWWFWGAAGVAVVTVAATAVLLTSGPDCPANGGCVAVKTIPMFQQ